MNKIIFKKHILLPRKPEKMKGLRRESRTRKMLPVSLCLQADGPVEWVEQSCLRTSFNSQSLFGEMGLCIRKGEHWMLVNVWLACRNRFAIKISLPRVDRVPNRSAVRRFGRAWHYVGESWGYWMQLSMTGYPPIRIRMYKVTPCVVWKHESLALIIFLIRLLRHIVSRRTILGNGHSAASSMPEKSILSLDPEVVRTAPFWVWLQMTLNAVWVCHA